MQKSEEDDDEELLLAGWEALQKAIDAKNNLRDAKSTETTSHPPLATANEQVEAKRTSDSEFALEIADWVILLIKQIAFLEKAFIKDEKKRLQKLFINKKNKDKKKAEEEANSEAKKHLGWNAVHGKHTAYVLRDIRVETDKVRLWRNNGRRHNAAPSTPILDRIKVLCDKSKLIDRPTFIHYIELSCKRNELAHVKVPEPKNYFLESTMTADFSAMKQALLDKNLDVQQRHESGNLSDKQSDIFEKTIQVILKMHFVDVGDNANVQPTEELTRKVGEYLKNAYGPEPPDDYPNLLQCDWDDLVL
ncbi:hypothetical protein QQS21_005214 [Conoideocrella luteorostrata]|uniref:Uncharacterized protein n=1 Tax=Conoideocrella luteorostrata TaxID=1105319 RepID=A0AAJ0CSC0_9HYPO|nr:hypothetical protein QQS21_005214 [Conoideocrella luteorostrata]